MDETTHSSGITPSRRTYRKGLVECSTPKEFLELLLLSGGILAALAISPALLVPAILIRRVQEDPPFRSALRSSYAHVRRQKYINIVKDKNGNQRFSLTKKGRIAALRYRTERVFAERTREKKLWDKQWRIFLFDIPANERNTRNALRYFIKRLGMVQLQKSAWIYPHDCSGELTFIKEIFNLSDDEARLVVSRNIGNDKKFRNQFSLPL